MTYPIDPATGLPTLPSNEYNYTVESSYYGDEWYISIGKKHVTPEESHSRTVKHPWWKFKSDEVIESVTPSSTVWKSEVHVTLDKDEYPELTKELILEQAFILRGRLDIKNTNKNLLGTYPPKSL